MSSEQMERELLELAAKAAGIRIYDFGNLETLTRADVGDEGPVYWSPLTDDGDALRLAVKLNLRICLQFTHVEVEAPGGFVYEREDFGDPLVSTRLAIVRAAAQLAKGEGN